MLTRRSVLALGAFAGLGFLPAARAETAGPLLIKVHKDPDCGCCAHWVDHLRANGFKAEVTETSALWEIKERLGVPRKLASCHTAEIAGYVVEGHVPSSAIERLLREKPVARGLAVPGMPIGSPGMEVEGQEPEIYEVMLFGSGPARVYERYKGVELLTG